SSPVAAFVQAHLGSACPFTYQSVYQATFKVDDEMILSRYPVAATEVLKLKNNFRNVLYARIDHPIGPLDVFSTHLASGSDGAEQPCDGAGRSPCREECRAAGAATLRQCQGVQTANFVAARHTVATPAVLTGDFNDSPGSFVYDQITSVHGFLDTYLAA